MDNDLHLKTPKKPATPVPAATVILLRDSFNGVEVLMVQRTLKADFAGGALLFPGGKVDDDDYKILSAQLCDFSGTINDDLRAIRIAGTREVFEEAGILFAREEKIGNIISNDQVESIKARYRESLLLKETTFSEILEAENLTLATDLLIPFAHWITPINGRKRFDTHFLIAMAPHGHVASHDGSETLGTKWIKPEAALEDAEAGRSRVVFPTRMNLKKVGKSPDSRSAIETAKNTPIVTVLPEVYEIAGGRHLKIPLEAGYGISEITVDYAASDQPPPSKG
tara:strand:+ start:1476 stop:2321 length:846 start_codon:yes stop_codon:yes gene_type:complete